jgi:hypothetical protein
MVPYLIRKPLVITSSAINFAFQSILERQYQRHVAVDTYLETFLRLLEILQYCRSQMRRNSLLY